MADAAAPRAAAVLGIIGVAIAALVIPGMLLVAPPLLLIATICYWRSRPALAHWLLLAAVVVLAIAGLLTWAASDTAHHGTGLLR
jgi:uncharacterized membrane protein YbaN (DUF454 family)